MANIASTDVTVTVTRRSFTGRNYTVNANLAVGDGALEYRTGGFELPKAGFGFKQGIVDVLPSLTSTGYATRYDVTNNKLLLFMANVYAGANVPAANGPLIQVADQTAIAASNTRVVAIGW